MKWDDDFDDPPTYSQISATLWQGGTEDEDTTIRARKRLATVNDVEPFDAVVSLCAHSMPFGWFVRRCGTHFQMGLQSQPSMEKLNRLLTGLTQSGKLAKGCSLDARLG
jgi:hypothetical protein